MEQQPDQRDFLRVFNKTGFVARSSEKVVAEAAGAKWGDGVVEIHVEAHFVPSTVGHGWPKVAARAARRARSRMRSATKATAFAAGRSRRQFC